MDRYQDLIKAIILMVGSLAVALFMYRKGYFKSHPEANFAVKVLDKRLFIFLLATAFIGLILIFKEIKKM